MYFRQMQALVEVMDTNSFSKAAKKMSLSQPTVSSHIAALEKELGMTLIVRTTKEIFPTDAGRLLYGYAKRMLALREDAHKALERFACEMRRTVTVAASSVPGDCILPRLLHGFRERYPDINVEIHRTDSRGAVEMVTSRQVEIGFCGTLLDVPKCMFTEFAEDRLVIVAPNTDQYRRYLATGVPLRRLVREPFISREQGSGTRKETEMFLREMGVDAGHLRVVREVDSTEEVRELVRRGEGVAVISKSASEADCLAGQMLAFEFNSARLRRKLYLLRAKNGVLSPVAQAFYSFAEEYGHMLRDSKGSVQIAEK